MTHEQALNEARKALFANIEYAKPQDNSENPKSESGTPKEKSQQEQNQSTQETTFKSQRISTQHNAKNNSQHEHRNSEQDNSTEQGNSQSQKGYSFYSAREFYEDIETENYLIDGFVQKEALQMIYGEPGCGKTFITFDMSCCISCTEIKSWHGRDIEHGDVIYFVGESVKGTKRRFRGWCDHHNVTPEQTQINFCDEVFKIDDDAHEHCIETTIAEIKKMCEKPVLIVIDTLNVYMGGDENKTVDAGKFIAVSKKLIKEFGSTVLIISHVGVSSDAKNRVRGSSAFKGAMDIEIQVTKQDNLITLKQNKHKEGMQEKDLHFKLVQISIQNCFDKKGRPITTCVVERCESQSNASSEPQVKFTQYEQTAIRTFKEAIRRKGIRLKVNASQRNVNATQLNASQREFAAVELEDWRKVSYELSVKDNQSTKRGEFNKGREELCKRNILMKQTIEGAEYYCLDLSNDSLADNVTKMTVSMAIHEREKHQATAQSVSDTPDTPHEPPEPADAQIQIHIEPQHEPSNA